MHAFSHTCAKTSIKSDVRSPFEVLSSICRFQHASSQSRQVPDSARDNWPHSYAHRVLSVSLYNPNRPTPSLFILIPNVLGWCVKCLSFEFSLGQCPPGKACSAQCDLSLADFFSRTPVRPISSRPLSSPKGYHSPHRPHLPPFPSLLSFDVPDLHLHRVLVSLGRRWQGSQSSLGCCKRA